MHLKGPLYETAVAVPPDLFDAFKDNREFIGQGALELFNILKDSCDGDLAVAAVLALVTHTMLYEYFRGEHKPPGSFEAEHQTSRDAAQAAREERYALYREIADRSETQRGRDRLLAVAEAIYDGHRSVCPTAPNGNVFDAFDGERTSQDTRDEYRFAAALALDAIEKVGNP